jgi:hypothetical protein
MFTDSIEKHEKNKQVKKEKERLGEMQLKVGFIRQRNDSVMTAIFMKDEQMFLRKLQRDTKKETNSAGPNAEYKSPFICFAFLGENGN